MTGSVLAQSDWWPSPVKLPPTFINSRLGILMARRWTLAGIFHLMFMFLWTCFTQLSQVWGSGLRCRQCCLQMRQDQGQLFSVGQVVWAVQQGIVASVSGISEILILFSPFQTENRLAILAFPCNQFGAQEPGTNAEIKKFAEGYGVKFDMFEKIEVNGAKAHPLWVFLKEKQGGLFGAGIKWNFTKFVIDKNGTCGQIRADGWPHPQSWGWNQEVSLVFSDLLTKI